jgi:hypothetical protein
MMGSGWVESNRRRVESRSRLVITGVAKMKSMENVCSGLLVLKRELSLNGQSSQSVTVQGSSAHSPALVLKTFGVIALVVIFDGFW